MGTWEACSTTPFGVRSANPATSCASGRSFLRRAHISRSTRKRCGLGMPALSEEGFRVVSSETSCRFAVSGHCSNCTTTYKFRNKSREAATSSRNLTAWKLQIIEKGYQYSSVLTRPGLWGCFPQRWPPSRFW